MDALTIPEEPRRRIERVGEEFLASIYSTAMKRQPDNIEALVELGHVYTHLGRYQDGLEVDRRLVEIEPLDPTVRYNLACSEALVGDREGALTTLEVAMELGFRDRNLLSEDEDLASLREEPRFKALLEQLAADPE